MIARGLWVDCAPNAVAQPAYWSEYRRHGLTEASLMFERSGPGYDERYTDDQLAKVGLYARANDVGLGLAFWPEPNRAYLLELERRLAAMVELAGAVSVDLDCESNWLEEKLRGFASLEDAAAEVLRIVGGIQRRLDVRLEVTTYPFHPENSPKADLAGRAQRRYPQAYGVRTRTRRGQPFLVEWDSELGPERIVRTSMGKAALIEGPGVVCCGLAAYDQIFPGRRAADAMRKAYETAVELGAPSVRWWSSKTVFGPQRNDYASRFLLELEQAPQT